MGQLSLRGLRKRYGSVKVIRGDDQAVGFEVGADRVLPFGAHARPPA